MVPPFSFCGPVNERVNSSPGFFLRGKFLPEKTENDCGIKTSTSSNYLKNKIYIGFGLSWHDGCYFCCLNIGKNDA